MEGNFRLQEVLEGCARYWSTVLCERHVLEVVLHVLGAEKDMQHVL